MENLLLSFASKKYHSSISSQNWSKIGQKQLTNSSLELELFLIISSKVLLVLLIMTINDDYGNDDHIFGGKFPQKLEPKIFIVFLYFLFSSRDLLHWRGAQIEDFISFDLF